MKKIILLLLAVNLVFAQSNNTARSITVYKDGFAIVNEPIIWNLKAGKNIATFTNLSQNLLFDSPKLNVSGVSILSQTLNRNFKSSDSFLKNNIGMPIEVKPNEGSLIQGILMDVNGSSISVKTNKGLTVIHRSQTSFFTLKSSSVQDKFSPEISWELVSDDEKSVEADLTYISSGFLWKPVYTLIIDDSDSTATIAVNAEVTNNSNVNLIDIDLSVVEGNVPFAASSSTPTMRSTTMSRDMSPMSSVNSLGDFYIFSLGSKLKLEAMQTVQLPLMSEREIIYDKKYIFENSGWLFRQ